MPPALTDRNSRMSARPKQLLGRKNGTRERTSDIETDGEGGREGRDCVAGPATDGERSHRRDRANSLLLLPPSRPISALAGPGRRARGRTTDGCAALIRCARRPYGELGNGAQIDEGGREGEAHGRTRTALQSGRQRGREGGRRGFVFLHCCRRAVASLIRPSLSSSSR